MPRSFSIGSMTHDPTKLQHVGTSAIQSTTLTPIDYHINI